MEPLGLNKLSIFWKYYKDYENMYDNRSGNMHKKILKEISEEEIRIFSVLEENFMLLRTQAYSESLEKDFQKNINQYKRLVTKEALECLKIGKKPVITKVSNPWYKRILKK